MKKLIVIIIILAIIFVGMLTYKNLAIKANNNISIQEIERIETYITKIYMWKEITGEALPSFEDINQANDVWIWEAVKKNLEEYELTYEQIEEEANELFGPDLTKKFPKEGSEYLKYDEQTDKYHAVGRGLDEEEDSFLLNKIEKTKDGYEVEIVEYLEDYSNLLYGEEQESTESKSDENSQNKTNDEIIIRNLNEEEIGRIKSSEEESAKEIVKSNIDKFTKKKLIITTKETQNAEKKYFIKRVEK